MSVDYSKSGLDQNEKQNKSESQTEVQFGKVTFSSIICSGWRIQGVIIYECIFSKFWIAKWTHIILPDTLSLRAVVTQPWVTQVFLDCSSQKPQLAQLMVNFSGICRTPGIPKDGKHCLKRCQPVSPALLSCLKGLLVILSQLTPASSTLASWLGVGPWCSRDASWLTRNLHPLDHCAL